MQNPDNILVPLDMSEAALEALDYAVYLAKNSQSTLHLVYVVEPVTFPSALGDYREFKKAMKENGASYLAKLVEERVPAEVRSNTVVMSDDDRASKNIIDYATSNDIDLICLTTHGQGKLEHFLFGSTAERVITQTPCPVLIIPTRAK